MSYMYDKMELVGQDGGENTRHKMTSIRLSTADDPDRHERIQEKLQRRGSSISIYGRELFAALERYIDKHGKLPELPIEIVGPPAPKK